MKTPLILLAAAAALGGLALCADAGVLYTNAHFVTLDEAQPTVDAVLVEGGRVKQMGSRDKVFGEVGDAIVDLKGAYVYPGFIDAHGHMTGLGGLSKGVIDLSGTKSYDEVIALVAERASTLGKGRWIIGRGWDHERWADGGGQLPDHERLSIAVPDHPVMLSRVDGHALLANRNAMERAGVTEDTPDPSGGEIIRRPGGEPTGVFIDNAEELIEKTVPRTAYASDQDLILAAQNECLAAGLTSVHDMGISPAQIEIYRDLEGSGGLKLRVYGLVSAPYAVRWFEANEPFLGERFSVNGAKLYMDGAMGSRGAWMLEPYDDRKRGPDGRPYVGLQVSDPEFVRTIAQHGVEHGYQVAVHAIGDRANREVLDAFEAAFQQAAHKPGRDKQEKNEGPIGAPYRFRVEHAQVLHTADIRRFGMLGVIPSMQPRHCTSDMIWVEDRIGPERARGAYAWQSLIRAGAHIAGGSDFPVEPVSPLKGFYAAVTRQDEQGQPLAGWFASQKMTREQALKSFTIWAAEAEFAEEQKGTISVGKLADFTVLDTDIMECHPLDILKARVLKTVIGGEVVYEAPN